MEKKLIYIILLFTGIGNFTGCIDDPAMPESIYHAKAPDVTSLSIDDFTATSVTLSGEVERTNGMTMTKCGFCLGSSPSPTTEKTTLANTEKGPYTVVINDLKPNQTYYTRAFATNLVGTGYGKDLTFTTTSGLGAVKALAVKEVHASSALCTATITVPGEGAIKEKGFYVATHDNPTMKDSKIISTSEKDSFECIIDNLAPNQSYYYKAFVENEFGTFTSTTLNFTTLSGLPQIGEISTEELTFTGITITSSVLSEGEASLEKKGFCWSTSQDDLSLTKDTLLVDLNSDTFSRTLENLKSHTQYFAQAFIVNKYGIAKSNIISFFTKSQLATVVTNEITETDLDAGNITVGGEVQNEGLAAVTEAGICWSTQENPTIENDKVNLSQGVSTFTGTLSHMSGGTTYFIRAYAINTAGVAYGKEYSITTPSILTAKKDFMGPSYIQQSAAYCTIDDQAFLFGGDLGSSYSNQTWAYANENNEWTQLFSFPIEGRKWQTAVQIKDNTALHDVAYLFGGINKNGEIADDLYYYSKFYNEWSPKITTDEGNKPTGRYSAVAASTPQNATFYLIGGINNDYLDEVWSYSALSQWKQMPNFPIKQAKGIAVVINKTIYAGLGTTTNNGGFSRQLWSTTDAESWTEETALPDKAKAIQGAVPYEGYIYALDLGGTIWKYNPSSKEWEEKITITNNAEYLSHCIYVIKDRIYIGLSTSSVGSTLTEYNPDWDY